MTTLILDNDNPVLEEEPAGYSIKYQRQSDIIDTAELKKTRISIVGAGSLGSFTALALGKMGIGHLQVWDDDIVDEVNFSNQFFRKQDMDILKVNALSKVVNSFTEAEYSGNIYKFSGASVVSGEILIALPDNMETRSTAYKVFLSNDKIHTFIDARAGAELMRLYVLRDKSEQTREFYEETLYDDNEAEPVKCTAQTIIYNVMLVSSFIGRAVKAVINKEEFPKEVIFSMARIDDISYMIRG